MATLGDIIEKTNTEVFDWLARDADVPTVTTAACQGDVSILRQAGIKPATTAIPTTGIAIVRGENGGNTHSLHGDGYFNAAPARDGSLELGTLTVPAGSEAHLLHPEHGALTILPGTYRIGRQREYAGEWRQVAD